MASGSLTLCVYPSERLPRTFEATPKLPLRLHPPVFCLKKSQLESPLVGSKICDLSDWIGFHRITSLPRCNSQKTTSNKLVNLRASPQSCCLSAYQTLSPMTTMPKTTLIDVPIHQDHKSNQKGNHAQT